MVLVDTDILIDYLRGNRSIKDQLEQLWYSKRACVSVLSVYELYAGIRHSGSADVYTLMAVADNFRQVGGSGLTPEQIAVFNLLAPMPVLRIDHMIAIAAGERRRQYRSQGVTLGDIDCMIASTAILGNMCVYTRNIKHYPNVKLYDEVG